MPAAPTTPARRAAGRAALNPSVAPPHFRSAAPRAGLLRAALLLSVLVALARGAALIATAVLLNRPDLAPLRVTIALLSAADVLSLATLVVAPVTWLLWVAWTRAVEQNTAALGVGEGSVGPGGAILWWLVPGLNLLVPFGQLLGLDRRLVNGERRSHDALIAVWWICLLMAAAAVLATTAPLTTTGASGVPAATLLPAGLASLAWLAAGLLSLRVVRMVQGDEDLRSVVVRQGWRPGAPSWSVAPAGARPPGPAAVRPPGPAAARPPGAAAAIPPGAPSWAAAPVTRKPPAPLAYPLGRPPAPATSASGRTPPPATPPFGRTPVPQPRARPRPGGCVVPLLLAAGLAGLVAGVLGSLDKSANPRGGIGFATPASSIDSHSQARQISGAPSPLAALSPMVSGSPAASSPLAPLSPAPGSGASPVASPSLDPAVAGNAILFRHRTAGDGSCTALDAASRPPDGVAAIEAGPGTWLWPPCVMRCMARRTPRSTPIRTIWRALGSRPGAAIASRPNLAKASTRPTRPRAAASSATWRAAPASHP